MTCTNPIEIAGQLDFPCGKCMSCRIQRTQEWAMRLVHEFQYHEHGLFITLTYDEDHLPKGGTLVKDHFVKWLKRFRKEMEPLKLKIYGNGEYGEETGRPHYHAILYDVKITDFTPSADVIGKYTHKSWPYGFIDCAILNYYTCRYVAGYIKRKLNGPSADEAYKNKEAPFKYASNGLGKLWAIDHRENIKNNQYINFQGKKMSVPRYYLKVTDLELDVPIDSRRETLKEEDFQRRYKNQKLKDDDEWSFNLRSKKQKSRNINARTQLDVPGAHK